MLYQVFAIFMELLRIFYDTKIYMYLFHLIKLFIIQELSCQVDGKEKRIKKI